MQLRMEEGKKVSRHQGQEGWRREQRGVGVLHAGKELHVARVTPLARLSWTALPEREGGNRLDTPRLASFVWDMRAQLMTLSKGRSVAGLREVVKGATLLASVRRAAYPRLVPVPSVLAGDRGFNPGGEQSRPRGEWAPGPDVELLVDEGGIYSW
jgi:hypothetical protein